MRKFYLLLLTIPLLSFSFFAAAETRAQSSFGFSTGPVFKVNSTADSFDANIGDGQCADSDGRCTLRAAIQESNHEPQPNFTSLNLIIFALPDPSVIELTLGELNVTSGMDILGPGARRLTVQRSFAPGTPNFRIFRAATTSFSVDIRRLTIRNGNAGGQDGGGIMVEADSALSLTDVAVTSNSAANGGGIANAGRVFWVKRVLVNSNSAVFNGGGIFNQVSFFPISGPEILNSTITNNTAAKGGAIYNNGSLFLANNTISDNSATVSATSIFTETGSIDVLNTIIGRDGPSSTPSLSGTFTSLGNNIVTDARNSTGFTNGANGDQVSEKNAIDPMLGVLTDNGGHTDTRALLTGSPAIDAGNDCVLTGACLLPPPRNGLASDQRGRYQRKVGSAVDIGAFEAGGGPPMEIISFGLAPRPDRLAFFGGAVAVLTSATTNQKIYGSVKPSGSFRFQNIPADLYILEINGKRVFGRTGPTPLGLDEIPSVLPSQRTNLIKWNSGYRFMVE